MRALWIAIALLLCAAAFLLLRSPGEDSPALAVPVERTARATAEPVGAGGPARPTAAAAAAPAATAAAPAATAAAPAAAATVPAQGPASAGGLDLGLDRTITGATVRPGRLLRKDGAIVADGAFTIRGDGTPQRPYEVTWELLMSASDTYIPRLGEKQIPQRIALLDGAHVRISGYIAFPLVATEASECLVMLNQWDGCCIGVPPSPYDAIEVKLSAPADNSRRHVVRVGTIEGVFRIDPYVVEKWLVGLYVMENATMESEL